jgi:hypothetical protein
MKRRSRRGGLKALGKSQTFRTSKRQSRQTNQKRRVPQALWLDNICNESIMSTQAVSSVEKFDDGANH